MKPEDPKMKPTMPAPSVEVDVLKQDLRVLVKRFKELGCKSILWTPEHGLEITMPVVIIQDQTTTLEID